MDSLPNYRYEVDFLISLLCSLKGYFANVLRLYLHLHVQELFNLLNYSIIGVFELEMRNFIVLFLTLRNDNVMTYQR